MKVIDYISKLNMKRKCKQHNCICLGEHGLNYLEEDGDMNVNNDESYTLLLNRQKRGSNKCKNGTVMINIYRDVCQYEHCSACVMFGTLFLFHDFTSDQIDDLRCKITSDFDKFVCGKSWIAIRN